MHDDRRKSATRFTISLLVEGRVPATPISARLLNISVAGCMIETMNYPLVAKAATIFLTITPSTVLSGQIAWNKGDMFGVIFHFPITPEVLADIRRRSGHLENTRMTLSDNLGRELPPLVTTPRGGAEA